MNICFFKLPKQTFFVVDLIFPFSVLRFIITGIYTRFVIFYESVITFVYYDVTVTCLFSYLKSLGPIDRKYGNGENDEFVLFMNI